MTVQILTGDNRVSLPTLASASVHCCVTSPPYWGLRDYGHADQIGLEKTPEEYVAALVGVFREVRRVLRDDGTLWLNIGDTYATSGGHADVACNDRRGALNIANRPEHAQRDFRARPGGPVKVKDLVGIPWMLAFALRADGWYLRAEIIWAKPSPMPESVRDRPTKAHEQLFLLAKSDRYYYDANAIAEPVVRGAAGSRFDAGKTRARRTSDKPRVEDGMRNRRSVWTVASEGYEGAHFAVMPTALVKPCILAGCPEGGTVLDPFGGSGTVGEVATLLGRHAILCELNPAYVALAEKRTAQGGLFAQAAKVAP